MNHSPTPWELTDDYGSYMVVDANGDPIHALIGPGSFSRDDLEYIVRSVNMRHTANEWARAYLEPLDEEE